MGKILSKNGNTKKRPKDPEGKSRAVSMVNAPKKGVKARALYTYDIKNTGDLSFVKGDTLYILSNLNEPWWLAQHSVTNKTGYIPSNYVVIDDGSPTSVDGYFDINHFEADKKLLLMGYPPGTYIVRPSTDPRHCALSIRHYDADRGFFVVKHYKIRSMDNGGYYISIRTPFPDIRSLITYYTQHTDGLCCRLTEPFPRQHRPPFQFREIEVNRKCITLTKKLGCGSFGEVWLGKWNDIIEVAVKMMRPNCMDNDTFVGEAKLMHQLHHPRIVQILGVCTEPANSPIYIITELMSKGALLNFLREDEGQRLVLPDMMLMLSQIAEGMAYLESKNFVHRDLRAANILVAEDLSVKVADFGLARVTEDEYLADPGTKFPIKWTAPEAGLRRIFSVKSDVWSFGVLMFEIITYGRTPYAEFHWPSNEPQCARIFAKHRMGFQNKNVLDEVSKGYRLPNPHGGKVKCPPEMYSIMLSCWDAAPEKRPTFSFLKDTFENFNIATERQYGMDE